MAPEPMPEPEGPEDERFVYAVTAAGVEALRRSAAAFDSEREGANADDEIIHDGTRSGVQHLTGPPGA